MTQSLGRKWAFGCLIALVVTVGSPPSVFPGGLFLYELGTPDVGLASAGWAARAQDASTLFKNPAGMSLLEGNQFQGGLQALYGSIPGFTASAGTTASGNSGGNPLDVVPGASGFYVHGLTSDLKVGFGVFSYFGLAAKWNGDWVGRYYVKDTALLGMSFQPTASYRVKEWLSIGAGLNIMYGYFKQTVGINNLLPPGQGDGQLQIKDQTVGFGANAGILLEPIKGTRFGVNYRSPVKLDFSDTPSFSNLGTIGMDLQNNGVLNRQVDLGMTVPQSVIASVFHQLTDRLAIMGDFGWDDWSQFGKVEVSVADSTIQNVTVNVNYQDTYHGAIGALYRLTDVWTLTGGFAYDSSMVKDQDRTLSLPVGSTYRYGIGTLYQATPALQLGFSYELAWTGDLPVDQNRGPLAGRVVGEYPDTFLNVFALNLTWRH